MEEILRAGVAHCYCPFGQSFCPLVQVDKCLENDARRSGRVGITGLREAPGVGRPHGLAQQATRLASSALLALLSFHRAFRGAEFDSDLLVGVARCHQSEDCMLPRCQGFKESAQRAILFSGLPALPVTRLAAFRTAFQEHLAVAPAW